MYDFCLVSVSVRRQNFSYHCHHIVTRLVTDLFTTSSPFARPCDSSAYQNHRGSISTASPMNVTNLPPLLYFITINQLSTQPFRNHRSLSVIYRTATLVYDKENSTCHDVAQENHNRSFRPLHLLEYPCPSAGFRNTLRLARMLVVGPVQQRLLWILGGRFGLEILV